MVDWLIDLSRNKVVIDWFIWSGIWLVQMRWMRSSRVILKRNATNMERWDTFPTLFCFARFKALSGLLLYVEELKFLFPWIYRFSRISSKVNIMKLRNLIKYITCNMFLFRSSTWSSTRSSRTRIRTQRSLSKYLSNSKTLNRFRYSFSRNSGLTT